MKDLPPRTPGAMSAIAQPIAVEVLRGLDAPRVVRPGTAGPTEIPFNHLHDLSQLRNSYIGLHRGEARSDELGILIANHHHGESAEYPLTERGRVQITSQAEVLATTMGLNGTTVICCSEFRAARESAALVASRLGVPEADIIVASELNARWPGDLGNEPIKRLESEVWGCDKSDPFSRARRVESAVAVLDRTTRIVGGLEQVHKGKTIILISDLDPLRILQTGMLRVSSGDHSALPHIEHGGLVQLPTRIAPLQ